jgi:hypothetical protein
MDLYESEYPNLISHNFMQVLRLISGSVCLTLLFLSLWKFPLSSQFIFMTHWGNHLTIYSNFIAYYLGQKKTTPVKISEAKGIYFTHSVSSLVPKWGNQVQRPYKSQLSKNLI